MPETGKLVVTAQCGSATSIPNEDGAATMALPELPSTVDVTITAPKGTTTASVTRDDTEVEVTWNVADEGDTVKLNGQLKIDTAEGLGSYVFRVAQSEAKLVLSEAKTSDEPVTPTPEHVVAEVEPGHYDGRFAGWTGFAVFVLVAALVVVVGVAALRIAFPDAPMPLPQDQWMSGTYAERVAHAVLLIVSAGGVALLLIGGWLAAMETRGRVRRRVKVTQTGETTRGLGDETGKAIATVVDALRQARGTVAVLSVAGIVLVAVLWAATRIAVSGDSPPQPESSPSASPTTTASNNLPSGSPTGGPSPSPSAGSEDEPTTPAPSSTRSGQTP